MRSGEKMGMRVEKEKKINKQKGGMENGGVKKGKKEDSGGDKDQEGDSRGSEEGDTSDKQRK